MKATQSKIETLAANFNLFTTENLPEKFKAYYNERIETNEYKKNVGLIPEFILNNSNYESGIFWECRIQDEGTKKECYYIEHSYKLVLKKDSSTLLMLMSNYNTKGKFCLHPYFGELRSLENKIDSYKKRYEIEKLKKPCLIGVFSEKKLNDWVNYCNDYINTLKALNNEISEKNKVAEKEINDFINSLNGKCTVRVWEAKYNDYKSWCIETELFEVNFKLTEESGYLQQEIKFKGNLNNVAAITTL
jgi:hypothetical protein